LAVNNKDSGTRSNRHASILHSLTYSSSRVRRP